MNLVIRPRSPRVPHSSVIRASSRHLEGHGFDSRCFNHLTYKQTHAHTFGFCSDTILRKHFNAGRDPVLCEMRKKYYGLWTCRGPEKSSSHHLGFYSNYKVIINDGNWKFSCLNAFCRQSTLFNQKRRKTWIFIHENCSTTSFFSWCYFS